MKKSAPRSEAVLAKIDALDQTAQDAAQQRLARMTPKELEQLERDREELGKRMQAEVCPLPRPTQNPQ